MFTIVGGGEEDSVFRIHISLRYILIKYRSVEERVNTK